MIDNIRKELFIKEIAGRINNGLKIESDSKESSLNDLLNQTLGA
jgi:hypothetical protein